DVLEPEVAVSVADPPLRDSLSKPPGVARQHPELPGPHGVERVPRGEPAEERLDLHEVLDALWRMASMAPASGAGAASLKKRTSRSARRVKSSGRRVPRGDT